MAVDETARGDMLPAVQQRPVAPELDRLARLGQWLAASEAARTDMNTKGAEAALRFYYAEQLELPPTAVTGLTVIKGRLFVGAEVLRALAARSGLLVVKDVSSSDTSCTALLLKDGEVVGEYTFTIDDAKKAGLIRDGSAWKTHPARMLWARASSYVIRDFAPWVSLGIAIDDEQQEYVRGGGLEQIAAAAEDLDDAELDEIWDKDAPDEPFE